MRKLITSSAAAVALVIIFAGQAAAAEINVRGKLGRTVEPGGWLILADQKYLLLNAERWRGESWFREGAEVEAAGEPRPGMITTHMEGTPFEARTLQRVSTQAGAPPAQATRGSAAELTRVVVTGDALVQERPDTAVITVTVVTQSRTALAAQQENAAKTDAVVRAVRGAAGAGAEVETSGYNLQPQYTYREGQTPLIQSYLAQNSVTVTVSDLTKVGPVIDAAATAGANQVSGLSFTLRQDKAARQRALAEATRAAMAKAQTIATALGGRVVRVVEVSEAGSVSRPIPLYKNEVAMSARVSDQAQTPVEVGSLDIRSEVTLVAEVSTEQR